MALRNFGWVPDVPDARDFSFRATFAQPAPAPSWWERLFPCLAKRSTLPSFVDLTVGSLGHFWPPVFDQGPIGSCTAQAHVGGMGYRLGVEGEDERERVLSRLMLYYEERGGLAADVGASLRDGIKAMVRVGCCPEELWPYDVHAWSQKPPRLAYEAAEKRRAITYARLSTLLDMRQCLAQGHPFVFGMSVYESFEGLTATRATLPMPRPGEVLLGGHAVCAVGYDDAAKAFLVRNSWGTRWGNQGHFWAPYAYLEDRNLSDDAWSVRTVPVA